MNLYKTHNFLMWTLRVIVPSMLLIALFYNAILGQIMYIVAFCIAIVMMNLKIRIRKQENDTKFVNEVKTILSN